MKKLLSCFWIFIAGNLYAQSNLFPATGNTGVGTISPQNLLHVAGITRVSNQSGQSMIYMTHGASSGNTYGEIDALVNYGSGWGSLIFQSAGGKVGIGVTGPQAVLDLAAATSNTAGSGFVQGFSVGGGVYHGYRQNSSNTLILDSYNGSWNLGFSQSVSGNVGIGTTSPSEKLSVDGNAYISGNISAFGFIKTKKLTVTQTAWPDYVFDKNYKLRNLASLEKFIKQNKHLPDVPSANEVEENGISVGDNQALLLKKIEELTLYIIKVNNENKKMMKQISELEKMVRKN